MSEEKKNLAENKLTDDQVEQVSGGYRPSRDIVRNTLEKETEKQKSAGTGKTRGKLRDFGL